MATIQIRTRIDRNLKKESDTILKSIGLDAGSYVTMALTQLVNRRGIAFAVMEPNAAYFVSGYGFTLAKSEKAGAPMRPETGRRRGAGKLREITSIAELAP